MENKLERLLNLSEGAKKVYDKLKELESNSQDITTMINNLNLLKQHEDEIYNSLTIEEISLYIKKISSQVYNGIGDIDYILYEEKEENYARRVFSKLINLYHYKYEYRLNNINRELNINLGFDPDASYVDIIDKKVYYFDRYARVNEISSLAINYITIIYLNLLKQNDMIKQKYELSYINDNMERLLLKNGFEIDKEIIDNEYECLLDIEKELYDYLVVQFSEISLTEMIDSFMTLDDIDETELYYDSCYILASLTKCGSQFISDTYFELSSQTENNENNNLEIVLQLMEMALRKLFEGTVKKKI